jgi:NADH:ubiquinone oxidoreductase subunit F (NADH-binding)
MAAADVAGDVPITLIAGPEEYLFGEETGLLQVIEGDSPLPRLFPPYLYGLFATAPNTGWSARAGLATAGPPTEFAASNPTLVNNVETLATVSRILAEGPEWHRALGTDRSPGKVVCTVVGDVVRPGVAEVEMGTRLRDVIDRVGGGVAPGRTVKAVLSGVSNPVITAEHLDVPLTYEDMEAIGSGLGSCGFIVYDDTASMVEVARVVSRFLYVESCGQCPPCKLGTGVITDLLDAVIDARATEDDIEAMGARLRTVTDGNRCYLPVQEQRVVSSMLRAFPEEFVAPLEGQPVRLRGLLAPKLLDLDGGRATVDEHAAHKRPDWTYDDEEH